MPWGLYFLPLFLVQRPAALMAHALTPDLTTLGRHYIVLNANSAALTAKNHHVRNRDRRFLFGYAAGNLLCRVLLGMTLNNIDLLHQDTTGSRVHIEHTSGLTLVAAGDHF